VWSDYASTPKAELRTGIRLDTTYYYWPSSWVTDRPGMFTGSGLPLRFTDLDGSMIDVYQAATQMTDESGQTFPKNIDTLLDNAANNGYYGFFTANMHTDAETSAGSDAIVASAKARGVPVISAKQLLDWVDGRNGSNFSNIAYANGSLTFSVAAGSGAAGLRVMLPIAYDGKILRSVTRNGSAATLNVVTVKGVDYGFVGGLDGAYVASYGSDTTAPAISAVKDSAAVTGTGTVTWTTDEAADSKVVYGTAAGALTSSATAPGSVTSHSVDLTGLTPGTRYFYRVQSADPAGNTTTSPAAASAPNSFMVPKAVTPSASTIDNGTLRSGVVANLATDDNVFYQVNSTTTGTRVASYWTSMTGVPTGATAMTVTYSGRNSRSLTQVLQIWNFTTSAWVQIDSRTVTTTEINTGAITPPGNRADYISPTGEVRVRLVGTGNATTNHFLVSDLLRVTYTAP
jgi:hypothetical protein